MTFDSKPSHGSADLKMSPLETVEEAMNDPYVTVEQYQFLPEAQAVRMHLESCGVSAQLADAETVSTDWALGIAVGYIKLQVRQSQTGQATIVLDALRARRKERDEHPEDPSAPVRCLACNSPLDPDQPVCPDCGWSYTDAEEIDDTQESESDTPPVRAPDAEGVMGSLRALKPLFVLLLLIPILLGLLLLVFLAMASLFQGT
ncbi:MAG: zinc ribbon domain-containing protein [Planctomycetes bacterium]|nr:zinc ribbon domain-containing protein [Planctomycetota bacterium]